MTRVLSIHATPERAQRSADRDGGQVVKGVKGTTVERPWAVIKERVG